MEFELKSHLAPAFPIAKLIPPLDVMVIVEPLELICPFVEVKRNELPEISIVPLFAVKLILLVVDVMLSVDAPELICPYAEAKRNEFAEISTDPLFAVKLIFPDADVIVIAPWAVSVIVPDDVNEKLDCAVIVFTNIVPI